MIKLDNNSNQYSKLKIKLIYIVLRLEKRIYNLAIKPIRNRIVEQPNIDSFYKQYCIKFGDLDKAITIQQELKKIKQKNILFLTFLGDFLNIAAKTIIDKEKKILALEKDINQELANIIIYYNQL